MPTQDKKSTNSIGQSCCTAKYTLPDDFRR